jgi:hypothetical protein
MHQHFHLRPQAVPALVCASRPHAPACRTVAGIDTHGVEPDSLILVVKVCPGHPGESPTLPGPDSIVLTACLLCALAEAINTSCVLTCQHTACVLSCICCCIRESQVLRAATRTQHLYSPCRAHQCSCVFLHKLIRVSEACEALGEDLCLHHHLRQVHRVFGNLAQDTAHLHM